MEEVDKTSLVQQRIKKMLENKKKNAVKDDADYMKRLKSGAEAEDQSGKPPSSIRLRRPVSAFKATESSHGIVNTPSSQKIQIDFKSLLITAFDHGTKLQQFLKDCKLNPNEYFEWLAANELFILSTLAKLKQIPEQKHSVIVQKQSINRITRELQVREQWKRCEQVEARISKILEDRLKTLSNYERTR